MATFPFFVKLYDYFRYIDWLQIIEFIEIWTSQGVNHFFFYFYTVSQLVMDILQYYEAKVCQSTYFLLVE